MKILDGKVVAAAQRAALHEKLKKMPGQPGLAVVLVGEDKASQVYVANKIKACQELGIESIERRLPASVSEAALQAEIQALNGNPVVHGILVQLPLPKGLDSQRVIGW